MADLKLRYVRPDLHSLDYIVASCTNGSAANTGSLPALSCTSGGSATGACSATGIGVGATQSWCHPGNGDTHSECAVGVYAFSDIRPYKGCDVGNGPLG